MRVVHSSERVLRGIAVEGSKEAGAGGSRPSGGFAGGSCGGVNAGTVGAKYVELSEGVRTPADAIDVHMRRRAMVGLQAAPPRLTPLERACGRSLKALHLLAHGAALFMQMHARCFLALRKKFYERRAAAGAPPLLPAPLAAAFQDECTEHEAREAQERAERRLSYVNRRVLRVWRERLDPNRLVKNEDTFSPHSSSRGDARRRLWCRARGVASSRAAGAASPSPRGRCSGRGSATYTSGGCSRRDTERST